MSHLRERFATEWKTLGLREQELKSLVLLGIDQARSFGVVSEPDVRLYIECMVLFHPDFARDPRLTWAGKVLGRKDLSGTEKMEQIHNHLVFGSPEGRWP
ncbi:MAG TPA: hypothetical protein VEU33_47805 [Archangium sp.]|nr:hypothetical protein [Archangium sp.]